MIGNQRGLLEIIMITNKIKRITLDLQTVNHFTVSFRSVFFFTFHLIYCYSKTVSSVTHHCTQTHH